MSKINDIRILIESENKRLAERFAILAQFQGLLFTALGVAWGKPTFIPIGYFIAILGILTSFSLGGLMFYAEEALYNLVKQYSEIPPEVREKEGPVIGNFSFADRGIIYWLGRLMNPSCAVPLFLIIVWVFIIFHLKHITPISNPDGETRTCVMCG